MNAPVNHRFPTDLRSGLGIAVYGSGGALYARLDLRNMLLSGTALSGVQVVGIDPATGVTGLYPLAGGGDTLPSGGAVGNVLGITSLSPRTYGWLVPSGGGVAFGTTAGTATEGNDARVVGAMQKAANGSDIADKAAFRSALQLGNAALATIGTTNGTVAAGNDPRFPTQALGNAAYRSVGSSSGTVAAGDDSRFPTAPLGAAAYKGVGATGGVASYDDPRFSAVAGQKTVKDYGAKGDGTTDDTAAFQAMYAAEKRISAPAGRYVLSGPVGSLTDGSGPAFLGAGAGETYLLMKANAQLQVSGVGWIIDGFYFKALENVVCSVKCGTVDNNNGFRLSNNIWFNVTESTYFLQAVELFACWFGSILNNQLFNGIANSQWRGNAFKFHYCVGLSVTNNVVIGFVDGYRVLAEAHPTQGYTCEGHQIVGNTFVANTNQFMFDGGLLMVLIGNDIDLTGPNGFCVLNYATCLVLQGNWFANHPTGRSGVYIWGGDRHVVSGNVWAFNGGSGTVGGDGNTVLLSLQNTTFLSIIGNSFAFGGQGIAASSGVNNATIMGNTFAGQSNVACNLQNVTTKLTYIGNLAQQAELLPGNANTGGGTSAPSTKIAAKVVVWTTGGASAAQETAVDVSAAGFSSKPVVTVSAIGNPGFAITPYWNFDSSSASSVVVGLKRTDGQAIPANNTLALSMVATAAT